MNAKFILGLKGGTKQVFDEKGARVPVTTIVTTPCYIAGMRTPEKDGYWAVKLAFGITKNIRKSELGLLKNAGIEAPLRFFKEIRLDKKKNPVDISLIEKEGKKGIKIGETEYYVGDEIKSSQLFTNEDKVQITGTSKGKGFQGVVRRWGFAGGPKTHGQSDRERAPGSIGMSATPGRVFKGKKMGGRMGSDTITVKNLQVVEGKDDSLVVRGLVPGPKGGLLMIKTFAH